MNIGLALLLGAATYLVGACASAPASTRPSATPFEGTLVPHDSVVGIDAETGDVVAVVGVGRDPLLLAVASGQIWTLDLGDGALTRIDPVSHQPSTVRLDGDVVGMASDGQDLWVASGERYLVRLNGSTGTEKASIALADEPLFRLRDAGFLAVSGGTAWLTTPVLGHASEPHTLWRIDTDSGDVTARYPIGRDPLTPLVAADAVWVPIMGGGEIRRLDAETGDGSTIKIGDIPLWVAAGEDSIWVARERTRTVARLSPADGQEIAAIDVGSPTRGVAVGGGSAWAATEAGVTEIDVTSNAVRRVILLVEPTRGSGPIGIAYLDGVVWVSVE